MLRRFWKISLACTALLVLLLMQVGARADQTCADPLCRDITGTVTDPHGRPIQGYSVWAKSTNGYTATTTTDAKGRYELHIPIGNLNGCPIIGGYADEFYTTSSYSGRVCEDAVIDLRPKFRVSAEAPEREIYFPDASKPNTIVLRLYANSRTNPAPFAGDPLTWTLTNHKIASPEKHVAAEGVFAAPVVTRTPSGIYRHVWTATLTSVVQGPTMVHVDWGRGTVFGQMMDCRMLFVGIGITSVQPAKALPGELVTVNGANFGTTKGRIHMTGYGFDRWIDPATIVEWTPTRISYLLPADAKNSWIRVYTATGYGPWCLGGSLGAPSQRFPIKVIPG